MSEPVRYDYEQAELNRSAGFYVRKEGHWVKWEDYAALKTDLDYVRKMRTQETLDLQEMSNIVNEVRAENTRLKGIILAQSSDFVRNAVRQEEEPKPEGWNTATARAIDLLIERDKEIERLRDALDLIVEGYEQGSIDGFNLGLMAAKECKKP